MGERWRQRTHQLAVGFGLGSAAAAMASIAASQLLLGAAVLCLLLSGARWQWPRSWPALACFVFWTCLALALSPEPWAGLPQLRKMYVLLGLPVVMTALANTRHFLWLVSAWVGLGACSALWGIQQFVRKWLAAESAGQDFYLSYVAARITGFNSHWMTFSGQLMVALLAGFALLLWGSLGRRARWLILAGLVFMGLALVLAFTRGVWIATTTASALLLWRWRPWAVAALPLTAALVLVAGPQSVRERARSLIQPRGVVDSNSHRVATSLTGLAMIRAHPLLGVGPERVGREFLHYAPARVLPLPEGYYAHLHSIYVHLAAERGIPAAAAITVFLLWPLLLWLRKRPPPRKAPMGWATYGASAGLLGILVAGLFEYNLGDSEILMLTLSLVALGERATLPLVADVADAPPSATSAPPPG